MQIGEENLSGAQKPNFFRLRLLHLHNHVRLGKYFGGIAGDGGATSRIGLIAKTGAQSRAGFDEHFKPEQIFEVDCPGLTSPVLGNFTWTKLPRPVYPLDEETSWTPPAN